MSQSVKDIELQLKKPFPVSKIKWRKGGGSLDLAYIQARDVMDRLDAVFGISGWQVGYEFIGERMICSLACRIGDDWITKADGADDTKIEGAKGGISDSLKRAAVLWGIGRYLYHPKAFDKDRNAATWATPEGFDELMKAKASVTKLHKTEKDNGDEKESKD
jgi:hypothetical protein|tara:strand:- start:472 stop:957 length:486 start_codon:yes stop_codon:yes gene_type:complete